MAKKKKKRKLHKALMKANREKAKEQGFFDGRFGQRVVPDKKKKAQKEACRKFKQENGERE